MALPIFPTLKHSKHLPYVISVSKLASADNFTRNYITFKERLSTTPKKFHNRKPSIQIQRQNDANNLKCIHILEEYVNKSKEWLIEQIKSVSFSPLKSNKVKDIIFKSK